MKNLWMQHQYKKKTAKSEKIYETEDRIHRAFKSNYFSWVDNRNITFPPRGEENGDFGIYNIY